MKNNPMTDKYWLLVILIPMTFFSCTENEIIRDLSSTDTFNPFTIPTVQTAEVSAVTASTATSGGSISTTGMSGVISRGVCWSTITEPTIELSSKTNDGEGSGNYTSSVTGLSANTRYYIRAYANHGAGTSYGNQVEFTTLPSTSVLFTADMSNVTGWTHIYSGSAVANMWVQSTTTYAGGVSPEVACESLAETSGTVGSSRLRSPAINTAGSSSVKLTFKYLFKDFGPGITLKVQTSSDGVNFTDSSWSLTSASERIVGPATATVIINQNVNIATTYISFTVTGDLYQFYYWCIDDIIVYRN